MDLSNSGQHAIQRTAPTIYRRGFSSRLFTDAGNPLRNYTYTYDDAGNRTKDLLQRPGQSDVTNTYSYAGGNELLSKQLGGGATTTYSYDGNGNLTGSTGGPSFTYNTKNQTKSIGSDAYTYSQAYHTNLAQANPDHYHCS